ncbi:MAG TPA: hypothetical protein VLE70_22660, partial [Anaerolineae bacterium]|nr:hypothetical protein [Anaerolineae bacterium]
PDALHSGARSSKERVVSLPENGESRGSWGLVYGFSLTADAPGQDNGGSAAPQRAEEKSNTEPSWLADLNESVRPQ